MKNCHLKDFWISACHSTSPHLILSILSLYQCVLSISGLSTFPSCCLLLFRLLLWRVLLKLYELFCLIFFLFTIFLLLFSRSLSLMPLKYFWPFLSVAKPCWLYLWYYECSCGLMNVKLDCMNQHLITPQ